MALSKVQTKRLGVLLATMFEEEVPVEHIEENIKSGYLQKENDNIKLTEKGIDEKNRLCTLAGLNIKYQSEVKSKSKKDKDK
tara:strand:+ start:439 stop:684 length:246 start_codon:yes stop_codon:yes gene_type:complete